MEQELHITARDIRRGDVFTLHGHERRAAVPTWPTAFRGHVHITFVGGGDAVIPADRPITVTRTVANPATNSGVNVCRSDVCGYCELPGHYSSQCPDAGRDVDTQPAGGEAT